MDLIAIITDNLLITFFIFTSIVLLFLSYKNRNLYLSVVGAIAIVYILLYFISPSSYILREFLIVGPSSILLVVYLLAIAYFSEELFIIAKDSMYLKVAAYLSALISVFLLVGSQLFLIRDYLDFSFMTRLIVLNLPFFLALIFTAVLITVSVFKRDSVSYM